MNTICGQLLLPIVALTVFLGSISAPAHEGHHSDESVATPILGESIFNLSSKWTTQDGKTLLLKDFHGHPAFLAMVYTSCEKACPLIIEDLKKIDKQLPETAKSEFAMLLFSFDTKRDTPEHLRAFAEKRKLDMKRWTLFNGNERSVRELAAVLGISYKRDTKGDFDHSNVITLIDAEGLVRYQQMGLNQDPKQILTKASELRPK